MIDSRDDNRTPPQSNDARGIEKTLMSAAGEGALNRWTEDAKNALNKGEGLPRLEGDWHDLHTHYVYTKAIETGLELPEKTTRLMAQEMSHRMDSTVKILSDQGLLEPLNHGVRLRDSDDNGFSQNVAYVQDMRLFVVTSPNLAYGEGKRRVFTPDEFNELYERPDDYS